MSREEMRAKVEELKERKFLLAMKSHWTFNDDRLDTALFNEIMDLEEKLKNI